VVYHLKYLPREIIRKLLSMNNMENIALAVQHFAYFRVSTLVEM